MTASLDGTLGVTFPDSTTQATGAFYGGLGFRNRIINGAMVIDQRNAGASVSFDNSSGYSVDRWFGQDVTDGAFTLQQVSDAPGGFTKSLKFTTTTADASLSGSQWARIKQVIEGFNIADLGFGAAGASTVTVSFWVKSSLTGTFGGSFVNDASNRSYPFTYTISVASTWEQKTVTISGDTTGTWLTTNGAGIQVIFGLGVGSTFSGTAGAWAAAEYYSATGAVSVIGTLNATWQITGVQLEKGSTATSFDYRPYGTELALCQRYLPAFPYSATTYSSVGQCTGATSAYVNFNFPVQARVAATGIVISNVTYLTCTTAGGGGAASTNITYNGATNLFGTVTVTVASGLVAGNITIPYPNNSAFNLYFTGCEL